VDAILSCLLPVLAVGMMVLLIWEESRRKAHDKHYGIGFQTFNEVDYDDQP
jgi:hypothetical protein